MIFELYSCKYNSNMINISYRITNTYKQLCYKSLKLEKKMQAKFTSKTNNNK